MWLHFTSLDTEMNELIEAITGYLETVGSGLKARLGREADSNYFSGKIRPVPGAVRTWFEEWEDHPTWNPLIRACARIFSQEGHTASLTRYDRALKNWLRRRGTYLKILYGTAPNPTEVADELVKDFRTTWDRVTFLVLLEGVAFTKAELDFGEFQIIRPKADYLEDLLTIPVNRMFYPQAVTSTKRLTDHCYLRCETQQKRLKLGKISATWELVGGPVQPAYTGLDVRIEAPLKLVTLWNWQAEPRSTSGNDFQANDPWLPFSIPFILLERDNPFESPPPAPPVEKLEYEPTLNAFGEEDGEVPTCLWGLNKDETAQFEVFLRTTLTQWNSVREVGGDWGFLDLGLNHLLKGFFSSGLDQLLWHIVALEAIMGEKGLGVTNRLARRIAAIFSGDQATSDSAKKAFQELYELRSSLVHGRSFKAQTDSRHLRNARHLARTALTRMLALLSQLSGDLRAGNLKSIPTREHILAMLDLDEESRANLAELARVFPKLSG